MNEAPSCPCPFVMLKAESVWWKQVVKGLKKQLDVKSAKDEKDSKWKRNSWRGGWQSREISRFGDFKGFSKIFTLILGEAFQLLHKFLFEVAWFNQDFENHPQRKFPGPLGDLRISDVDTHTQKGDATDLVCNRWVLNQLLQEHFWTQNLRLKGDRIAADSHRIVRWLSGKFALMELSSVQNLHELYCWMIWM